MPHRSAYLLFLLAIAAAPGSVLSQAANDAAARLFARLDRDRSGVVTAREFTFMRGLDFQRLDRNKDGYIGDDEFVEKRSPRDTVSARVRSMRLLRVRRFAEIDGNRDGRLARREYMAYGRRLFARLDRNGDTKLTLTEVRGNRARAAVPAGPRQAGGLFEQLDNNADGTISLGELLAARRIVFRRLDIDKSGTISVAEFAAREIAIGAPSAQAPPPLSAGTTRAGRRFLQLDRDKDGQLTAREYLADGKARFAAADRDGNARLDRAEFSAGAGR